LRQQFRSSLPCSLSRKGSTCARHLREQGVAANATERAARGVTRPQKADGSYRAVRRGASTHWRQRAASVAREMATGGDIKVEPGKAKMLETRREVVRGWTEVADDLGAPGSGGAWAGREGLCEVAATGTHRTRMAPGGTPPAGHGGAPSSRGQLAVLPRTATGSGGAGQTARTGSCAGARSRAIAGPFTRSWP
jgi:hypothetical protein